MKQMLLPVCLHASFLTPLGSGPGSPSLPVYLSLSLQNQISLCVMCVCARCVCSLAFFTGTVAAAISHSHTLQSIKCFNQLWSCWRGSMCCGVVCVCVCVCVCVFFFCFSVCVCVFLSLLPYVFECVRVLSFLLPS